MQVQAIQGYFDNGLFYQQGRRVALPERQMVIVNVLDVPIDVEMEAVKNTDIDFWKEFDKVVKDSLDEELLPENFPRVNFKHELVLFEDEGQRI